MGIIFYPNGKLTGKNGIILQYIPLMRYFYVIFLHKCKKVW
jgi:hypothetical protein